MIIIAAFAYAGWLFLLIIMNGHGRLFYLGNPRHLFVIGSTVWGTAVLTIQAATRSRRLPGIRGGSLWLALLGMGGEVLGIVWLYLQSGVDHYDNVFLMPLALVMASAILANNWRSTTAMTGTTSRDD